VSFSSAHPLAPLAEELDVRRQSGLWRSRRILQSAQGPRIRADGQDYVAFCSNDYLGLASHPDIGRAAITAVEQFGVGAGASHLLTGHHQAHHELEQALAAFVELPQALLFSTGYMANLGIVGALLGRHDAVFADRLNHASLNDAVLLSHAKLQRYAHLDLDALENHLSRSKSRRKLVVTDAVFSMDGDIAPLPGLVELCERHDAWLLVDDAHGFGVLGVRGSGTLSHYRLRSSRVLYMATLGKAAGVFGAFAAGEPDFIQTLVQKAHTYVYTTACPPLLAAALTQSLQLMAHSGERRQHLAALIECFKSSLQLKRWKLLPSVTAIQPVVIGSVGETLAASEALLTRRLLVPAIRPPTVPQGSARLRVSFSAGHTLDEVQTLAGEINALEAELCKEHA
jgi:8-amino-7-oxononanoate synthase